jgi:hypothetical protein
MCPQGQPSHSSILPFKICLLNALTDLIKPPLNFGIAAASNKEVLGNFEASLRFA